MNDKYKSNFFEKHVNKIFASVKFVYLICTIALAGAIDKWKSDVVSTYDEVWVFIVFWIMLFSIGVLFTFIWRAKTIDQLNKISHGMNLSFLLPMFLLTVLTIGTAALISTKYELALPALAICFIAFSFVISSWGDSAKTINLREWLKKAFFPN